MLLMGTAYLLFSKPVNVSIGYSSNPRGQIAVKNDVTLCLL